MAFSLRRRRQPPRGRYTPNLWPVWIVAPLAVIVAGLVGWGIYHQAYGFFADEAARQKPSKSVDVNDVLKATVTVLTLAGAVLAGLYAYRKQLLSEGDAHRADASQLAERYTTAAEQLGHDQAAVRLAGVYALARLADDWEEQRQVCVDVLCAYLRMPYDPDPGSNTHRAGEKEVRQTIISVIRDHLRNPGAPTAWCTYDFDFTGAVFDGGDLSYSHFHGAARFNGAWFTGGTFTFSGARFSDGRRLTDGELHTSTVRFSDAQFTGGTVVFGELIDTMVFFDGAQFTGGTVRFQSTHFTDGLVDFDDARFTDGMVSFHDARFTGTLFNFERAQFEGGSISFDWAHFTGGIVNFERAQLTGSNVTFNHAQFGGTAFVWGPFSVPAGA